MGDFLSYAPQQLEQAPNCPWVVIGFITVAMIVQQCPIRGAIFLAYPESLVRVVRCESSPSLNSGLA
jgi:hypothetical protein